MVTIKKPGKLFIGGEYSVVESYGKAILIAVDRFIEIKLDRSESPEQGKIESFNGVEVHYTLADSYTLIEDDIRFNYIISALNIVKKYLDGLGYISSLYDISITSHMENEDGIKYGIGSSAGVVAGVIEAVLKLHELQISKRELFKLSVLATLSINREGSCADIATVIYGGCIFYTKFNDHRVLEYLDSHSIADAVAANWEGLEIESLDFPDQWDFNVIWTKKPASSIDLVSKIKDKVTRNEKKYSDFLGLSENIILAMRLAIIDKKYNLFRDSVEANREALNRLAHDFNSTIETKELNDAISISEQFGLVAKSSGAGGGDCAVAFTNKEIDKDSFIKRLEDDNLEMLDFKIYKGDDHVQ